MEGELANEVQKALNFVSIAQREHEEREKAEEELEQLREAKEEKKRKLLKKKEDDEKDTKQEDGSKEKEKEKESDSKDTDSALSKGKELARPRVVVLTSRDAKEIISRAKVTPNEQEFIQRIVHVPPYPGKTYVLTILLRITFRLPTQLWIIHPSRFPPTRGAPPILGKRDGSPVVFCARRCQTRTYGQPRSRLVFDLRFPFIV